MKTLSLLSTVPPIPITAIVVDLRNFTPHLIAATPDSEGISGFCHFLTRFYGLCLESCLVALPQQLRFQPPLYLSSTGDGVLIVFFDQAHHAQAFLAAHIMHIHLRRYCDQYNLTLADPNIPRTSFGMGLESGTASRIRAQSQTPTMHPIVDTFIGNCINLAARAEAVSKNLHRANTIIGPRLTELLSREIGQFSYDQMESAAKQVNQNDDTELFKIYARMDDLCRALCVTYVHHHVLKGISKPVPLFRLSDRAVTPENPRFMTLIEKLTRGSEAHLKEVLDYIGAAERKSE